MSAYLVLGFISMIIAVLGSLSIIYALVKVNITASFEHVMVAFFFINIMFLLIGENIIFLITALSILNLRVVQGVTVIFLGYPGLIKGFIFLGTTASIFLILRMSILTDFNPAYIVGTSFISGVMLTSLLLSMEVRVMLRTHMYIISYQSIISAIFVIGSLFFLFMLTEALILYKIMKYKHYHSHIHVRILVYDAISFALLSFSMLVLGLQRTVLADHKNIPVNFFLSFLGLSLVFFGLGLIKYPFPYRLLVGGECLLLSVRNISDQQELFRVGEMGMETAGLLSTAVLGSTTVLSVTMDENPFQFHARAKNAHVITVQHKDYLGILYLRNRGVVISRYALKSFLQALENEEKIDETSIKTLVSDYLGFLFTEDVKSSRKIVTIYFHH